MLGAGDVVYAITRATGIGRVAEWISRGNCGCQRRRETLNRLIPFGRDAVEGALCPKRLSGRSELKHPVRNLIMFIDPLSHWRRDVEHIKQVLHLFSGKRIITVDTDNPCDLDAVKGAFCDADGDIMWITAEWESGLSLMLECVRSCRPMEITFCCRATGSQGYGECLNMPLVEKQLETFASVHFAGVSWFRNARLFSQPGWRKWNP